MNPISSRFFVSPAAWVGVLGALLLIDGAIPETAAAPGKSTARPRPRFHLHPHLSSSRRNTYRPSVKIEDPAADFRGGKAIPVAISFSARRGFVSRVELLVDGRLFWGMTLDPPATSGVVRIRPDLGKAGPGAHTLRARAWQGRPGYQSVHAVSIKRKFTN